MVSLLSSCRRRLARRGDNGFTLVEAVVAIAIALVVFIAVAGVMIATTKASLLARQNQQSIEAASEGIEQVRALNFAAVAMDPDDDLDADDNLTPSGTSYVLDPDGATGDLGAEQVIALDGGGVTPHRRTLERNTTTFEVFTYVTTPPTDTLVAGADYRRVTVLVRWSTGTNTRERRTSTVITNTRRGLPLPKFDWGTETEVTVNAGASLHLPFSLTNRGAPDRWNFQYSASSSVATWNLTWRQDLNSNGQYDAGEPEFDDSTSDADAIEDSGLVYTDETVEGVLTGVPPASVLSTTVVAITLQATSASQPDAETATQEFTDTVTVLPLPTLCPGCTPTTYYLQNQATAATGDIRQERTMVLTPTAPLSTATTLWNFDREIDSRPGRRLLAGGTGYLDTNEDRSAHYTITITPTTTFGPTSGSANITLTFWAQKTSASSSGTITFHAYVLRQAATGSTRLLAASGSTAVAGSSLSSWSPITVTIPVPTASSFTVNNNRSLELKIQTSTPTGDTVELAYDAYTYPSSIVLPKR